jgi:nicotinate-nucleotide--dimethylbenzimidazole phosphoribosyltransferase
LRFSTLNDLRAACRDLPASHADAASAARARQAQLTKPPGSLGRLEDIACWLAEWQGREKPRLERVAVGMYAGNHGIAARGVSAFPPEVTVQMVANYAAGGAGVNALARAVGAEMRVVTLELDRPTADFTQGPAMQEGEFLSAVQAGYDSVSPEDDLFTVGEMGIGNTTVSAALCAALLGGDGAAWVGRGSMVGDDGFARKRQVVDEGLARHRDILGDPLLVAAALGGRELAAMMGAALAARRHRVPMMLDGFVCGAAVLPLWKISPDLLAHCQAGHVSAEPGHRRLLDVYGRKPIVDLGMRLGEATGALTAILVARGALACHNEMATFGEAGVAAKIV